MVANPAATGVPGPARAARRCYIPVVGIGSPGSGGAMPDYTAVTIDEVEAIYRGAFKRARASLGVTSFGMQVIDMPPSWGDYPDHDHSGDGQEEVYLVLRGSGEMSIEGETVQLDTDTMVRVSAGTKRKITPGPEGMRL